MHAVDSPCSAQWRVKYTFAGEPVLFHTSAGASPWQTGQREIVRLSDSLSDGKSMKLFGYGNKLRSGYATVKLQNPAARSIDCACQALLPI
jgi:hypothetical protein